MKEKRNIRQDGQKTKITILQWAGRLIAEKGFDSVTSKEICEKAGVNQAAVKYHFGSREDLYFSLLKYVHNRLISMEIRRLWTYFRREKYKSSLLPKWYFTAAWFTPAFSHISLDVTESNPFSAMRRPAH